MSVPVVTIDAFAEEPFQGNPAAVCFLPEPREVPWMQAIAREMNLSETAYLSPRADGPSGAPEPGCYDLRWFTPAVEVDLCGHATLASAHALWSTGRLDPAGPAHFHTRSGWLAAHPQASPYAGRITLDFPATRPVASAAPKGLAEALGAPLSWVGKSRFDYLVEVADEAAVRGLDPDLVALARLPVRGLIVTARGTARGADQRFDFVSRFFAPAAGVAEDPVTGSAHCALAPYWAERLGANALTGYQASSRGGVVGVEVRGERVQLTGRAITVMSGQLLV